MTTKDCEDTNIITNNSNHHHVSPSSTNHNAYCGAPLFGRSESCGSEGSLFFADMTLDLSLAKAEATPRTDKLFASMVAENPGRASGGGIVKRGAETETEIGANNRLDDDDDDDLLRDVPPMPLIDDATFAEDSGGVGIAFNTSGLNDDHNYYDCDDHDEETNNSGTINSNSINNVNNTISNNYRTQFLRPSPPRRPRDVSYAILACIVLPIGLLLPHLYYPNEYIIRHNEEHNGSTSGSNNTTSNHSWSQMAMSSISHTIILFSTLVATLLSLLMTRLLYSHPPGGGGNDKRHAYIGRIIFTSSHLCTWLYPTLALYTWIMLPNVRRSWAIVIPLGMMVRDVCFRMKGPSPALRTQHHPDGRGRIVSSSSSSLADRRTFFRVLAVAALDIISRSLRRKSFVRTISVLLILQFVVVSLWWGALSVVLSVKVYDDGAIMSNFVHFLWLLITLVSGKWATEIIIRLLGYVTSGGVAVWFGSQTTLIMERMRVEEETRVEEEVRKKNHSRQKLPQSTPTKLLESISEDEIDATTEGCSTTGSLLSGEDDDHHASFGGKDLMPEAYRIANASVYAPIMDFDEDFVRHDDEDDDDDDSHDNDDNISEENGEQRDNYYLSRSASATDRRRSPFSLTSTTTTSSSTTVKSFLNAGCTLGFGSVAQCGLLGGPAQMLWSFVRNINAMGFFLRRRHPQSNSCSRGFRGMEIATDSSSLMANPQQWHHICTVWWSKIDDAIRRFVRSHSDLAMSHVAMYYKSYQMAAKDVAALIETSGVESIIHDDITTHLCSSVCHLASGLVTMFFGVILAIHRDTFASTPLADASLFEILFVAYMLCHTILFTAIEPLRSAIKAVYVCFAEHPLSLSQAFPLIYQRLSRISEASSEQ